jgi:hypothetical protein
MLLSEDKMHNNKNFYLHGGKSALYICSQKFTGASQDAPNQLIIESTIADFVLKLI